MRTLSRIILTAAIAASLAVFATPVWAANGQPIVIKFSHVVANDTPKGQGAQMFKKLVEQKLGDRVKVEIYPNSSLYNDSKGLNALITGDIQMLAPSVAKLGEYSKSVQLFDLPFLFRNMNAVTQFEQSSGGQKILQSMQGHNILGLAYWHNGLRQMSANKALLTPRDARGLKLRVEPSDVLAAEVQAMHALPRKMAFSEVYQGMQTGVIDGQSGNTFSNIFTQNWQEVQSDVTESNSGVLDYMVITNAKFWNGLPGDVRQTLSQILAKVTTSVNEQAGKLNAEAKKKIAASGTTIHQLSDQQRKAWQKAEDPVFDQFRNEIGGQLIDQARAANP